MSNDIPWYLSTAPNRQRIGTMTHISLVEHPLEDGYEARFERVAVIVANSPTGVAAVVLRAHRMEPVLNAIDSAPDFVSRFAGARPGTNLESRLGTSCEALRRLQEDAAELEANLPAAAQVALDELRTIDSNISHQLRLRMLLPIQARIDAMSDGRRARTHPERWEATLRPELRHVDTIQEHVASSVGLRTVEEVRVLREVIGFADPDWPLPGRIQAPAWARDLATEVKERVAVVAELTGEAAPALTATRSLATPDR